MQHIILKERDAEVFGYVYCWENRRMVPSNFMDTTGTSTIARRVTVDMMVDCCWKLRLRRSTLHTAVRILDSYLAATKKAVIGTSMQFIGVAAMFIAAKFDESSENAYATSFSEMLGLSMKTELLKSETRVLSVLKFDIWLPTPLIFIERFEMRNSMSACGTEVGQLAYYILEMCLYGESLSPILPSLLAAASIYVARKALSLPGWIDEIGACTNQTESETKRIAADVANFLKTPTCRGNNAVNRFHQNFAIVGKAKFNTV
jgi:G2/mitotic-specific cyclin 2